MGKQERTPMTEEAKAALLHRFAVGRAKKLGASREAEGTARPLAGQPVRNDWAQMERTAARMEASRTRSAHATAAKMQRAKADATRERRERGGPAEPNQHRAAKGDLEAYTPRDFVKVGQKRELNPTHQVTARRKHPLADLLATGAIDWDEFSEGKAFGIDYERAVRECGAINLDSNGGGSRQGLTLKQVEAMDRLSDKIDLLGANEYDRKNRAAILIRVAGEQRTLSSLYPNKGRSLQSARNMLKIGLSRLVSAAKQRAAA